MANTDDTYNGWANYETWVIVLWINNDSVTQEYWHDRAREAWVSSDDKWPNEYIHLHSDNARVLLAEWLKDEHDTQNDDPRIEALYGTVYADLLNAALSVVDWYECADSLLSECDGAEGYEPRNRRDRKE